MERSDEWTLSPDWRLEVAGHIVVRDGRVIFARQSRANDKIVGRFENYKFQGLLEASCQLYYLDNFGVKILYCSTPGLIPKEWHDFDEDRDFAIAVKMGDRYYDLVGNEAISLAVSGRCFVARIHTPLCTIRRFSMELDRGGS